MIAAQSCSLAQICRRLRHEQNGRKGSERIHFLPSAGVSKPIRAAKAIQLPAKLSDLPTPNQTRQANW
ncbi:MAG: hypothetical protein WCG19_06960 [Chlorobiaceae bacterium]